MRVMCEWTHHALVASARAARNSIGTTCCSHCPLSTQCQRCLHAVACSCSLPKARLLLCSTSQWWKHHRLPMLTQPIPILQSQMQLRQHCAPNLSCSCLLAFKGARQVLPEQCHPVCIPRVQIWCGVWVLTSHQAYGEVPRIISAGQRPWCGYSVTAAHPCRRHQGVPNWLLWWLLSISRTNL